MEEVKGIRERTKGFEWNVSYKNKRYTGTAKTYAEAVADRAKRLKEAERGEAKEEEKRARNSGPTLKDIYELTCLTRWADTKSESTAKINAATSLAFFGENTPAVKITTMKVADFLEYLRKRSYASGTINRKMSALSTMMKTALDHEIIPSVPRFHRLKEYKGRERFVSVEEENKILTMLDEIGHEDFKTAVVTLIDTGIRRGELLRLEARDVDFSGGKYGSIRLWMTKGNKARTVPLTRRVSAALAKRVAVTIGDNGRIFPFTTEWLRGNWARVKKYLNLEDDPLFVLHILRHTCASRLVQRGVPILEVQRWLGHATIETTMRYAHLAPNSLYSFVDVLEKVQ